MTTEELIKALQKCKSTKVVVEGEEITELRDWRGRIVISTETVSVEDIAQVKAAVKFLGSSDT